MPNELIFPVLCLYHSAHVYWLFYCLIDPAPIGNGGAPARMLMPSSLCVNVKGTYLIYVIMNS